MHLLKTIGSPHADIAEYSASYIGETPREIALLIASIILFTWTVKMVYTKMNNS